MKDINIYLIRHAESVGNTIPDKIGQDPESPLSEEGMAQAQCLGARFSTAPRVHFDLIASSTYKRAFNTARSLAEWTNYHRKIIQAPELREYDPGEWKGKSRGKIYGNFQNLKDLAYLNMGFLFPGGESYHQVERRAASWLEQNVIYNSDIRKMAEERDVNVAVVSHGQTIRCILHYVMGFSESFLWRLRIDNTSIQHLIYGHLGWKLNSINDQSHLLK